MQTSIKSAGIDEARIVAALESLPDIGSSPLTAFQQKMVLKYYNKKGCKALSKIIEANERAVRRFAEKNKLTCKRKIMSE